jgi:hypothetical protein
MNFGGKSFKFLPHRLERETGNRNSGPQATELADDSATGDGATQATSPPRRVLAFCVIAILLSLWFGAGIYQAFVQNSVCISIWQRGGSIVREHGMAESRNPMHRGYRLLLGPDFKNPVLTVRLHGTEVTDSDLEEVARLSKLQILDLCDTQITDRGLEFLRSLEHLEMLVLTGTRITDRGLLHLQNHSALQVLSLEETAITDEGSAELAKLPKLAWVDFSGTRISDATLERLPQWTHLKVLTIDNCAVSEEAIGELRQAAPWIAVFDSDSRRPPFKTFFMEHFWDAVKRSYGSDKQWCYIGAAPRPHDSAAMLRATARLARCAHEDSESRSSSPNTLDR